MKNWGMRSVFAAAAIVTVSYPALAGVSTFTNPGTITHFEDYGSSLQVSTSAAITNPAGCASTALYLPKSTLTDAEKQNLSRDLLAAFVAGKNVQLKIDGTACNSGSPSYYAVIID